MATKKNTTIKTISSFLKKIKPARGPRRDRYTCHSCRCERPRHRVVPRHGICRKCEDRFGHQASRAPYCRVNRYLCTYQRSQASKIEGQNISSIDDIPFGHKICLKNVNKGDPVIKYDQIIGFASKNINPGEHVHSHNLEFKDFDRKFKVIEKKSIINEIKV